MRPLRERQSLQRRFCQAQPRPLPSAHRTVRAPEREPHRRVRHQRRRESRRSGTGDWQTAYAIIPGATFRIPWPHRSRPGRGQHARRHHGRRSPGAGNAHRHRRALRQREPDHHGRSHAAARRSRVCFAPGAHGVDQPGAFGLRGLRTRSAARRAHRRSRRVRHLGRHARLERAQESRRVPVVRSRARRRQPDHRRQRAIGQGQHHAARGVAWRAARLRAGAGADGCKLGHDRGRRLYRQRSFLPSGLHENRWEPCATGSP